MRDSKRIVYSFILLAVILILLFALNVANGSRAVALSDIPAILSGRAKSGTAHSIIWSIRLPRIVTAMILGGALAVSGFLLQTFFNNPIAGPFILGISSGSKLAVALVMIFSLGAGLHLGSFAMVLAAFAGAMAVTGFILAASQRVHRMSVLIICGVMVGYICSAITEIVVTFADDSNIVNLHNWSLGTFSGSTWSDVASAGSVVALAVTAAFLLSKPIGAYQLGESAAGSLGGQRASSSDCSDPPVECAVRGGDCICRTRLFCRSRGAPSYQKSHEDAETDCHDTRMLSRRSGILPLFRSHREDSFRAD